MTEAEWLTCDSIEELLNHTEEEDIATARKHRLFYVACCRRVIVLMPDKRSWQAVETIEKLADDAISEKESWAAMEEARSVIAGMERTGFIIRRHRIPKTAKYSASRAAACDVMSLREAVCAAATARERERKDRQAYKEEEKSQCILLREIYGNPFRSVVVDPTWLTSDVLALATGIYADRAFDRMPILADALQDACCDNADILDHCRQPSEHVRGCWAVDLLLGKE